MRFRPLLVILLVVATACQSSHACSAVGCASQVTVDVREYVVAHPSLTKLTLCAGPNCREFTSTYFEHGSSTAPISVLTTENRAVNVRLVVADSTREATVHAPLQRFQPNGRGCGPVCYQAHLRFTAIGQLVS